jgi:O-antigen/teichoic acid export membrane protein
VERRARADDMVEASPMNRVRTNILANYLGNGWSALLSLVATPLYVRFMGIEAYGLLGFYLTLQGVANLLDLGLSVTMNREMARYSALAEKSDEVRNFVRTLEVGYWAIGIGLGVGTFVAAPFLATHWVKAERLPIATVQQAIRIMSLIMTLQWPLSLYQGGLMGLQRQTLLSAINAGTATLRGVGAILILWLVSPTIVAFFAWQVVSSMVQTLLTTIGLWRSLPGSGRPSRFRLEIFLSIRRFAVGMSGIFATSLILTQLDKVILSRSVSLEMFGYYMLATTMATALTLLSGPVFTAVFPRFTALVALNDQHALKQLYHRSCQLMSVMILPTAIMVALFSREFLLYWTNDVTITQHTYLVARLLIVGTALNSLMNLPYALQLAYGWTRLTFYTNVIAALVLGPTLLIAISHYGGVGAAAVWVVLNVGYVLIQLQLMHRRLLSSERRKWYLADVGFPLVAALFTAGVGRWFAIEILSGKASPVYIAVIFAATLAASGLAASEIRTLALRSVWKLKTVGTV